MDKSTYMPINESFEGFFLRGLRDFLRGAMNAGYNPGREAGNSRYGKALANGMQF